MPSRWKRFGRERAKLPAVFTARSYDELDERRAVVKSLKRRARELADRVKSRDALTAERCRRVAYLELVIESLEVSALESGQELGGVYVQKLNLLERMYKELGIEANEEASPDLSAYLSGAT